MPSRERVQLNSTYCRERELEVEALCHPRVRQTLIDKIFDFARLKISPRQWRSPNRRIHKDDLSQVAACTASALARVLNHSHSRFMLNARDEL